MFALSQINMVNFKSFHKNDQFSVEYRGCNDFKVYDSKWEVVGDIDLDVSVDVDGVSEVKCTMYIILTPFFSPLLLILKSSTRASVR